MTTLYGIIIRETGELLKAESFKKFWKNYGGNSLYGWRMPKKVYETIGRAKAGFAHIPDEIKEHCDIASFEIGETIVNGGELAKEQRKNKEIKKIKREERNAKIKLDIAKKRLADAQREVEDLKNND